MPKKLKFTGSMKTYDTLELTPKRDVLFIIGDWHAKVACHKIPGVKGKVSLGVQNESRQRLTALSREHTGHSKHPHLTTQETNLHRNITRWSILNSDWLYFLQLKMEKLYTVSKQKRGQELTVAQIMNSLLQNSGINEENRENHWAIEVWPKSKLLRLYSRGEEQIQGIRSDRESTWRTMDIGP